MNRAHDIRAWLPGGMFSGAAKTEGTPRHLSSNGAPAARPSSNRNFLENTKFPLAQAALSQAEQHIDQAESRIDQAELQTDKNSDSRVAAAPSDYTSAPAEVPIADGPACSAGPGSRVTPVVEPDRPISTQAPDGD